MAAPPAHAATPWRFTEVTFSGSIPANSISSIVGTCPDGFTPVGAGLANFSGGIGVFELVSAFVTGPRTFQVSVHNYESVARQATANMVCAVASDVGALQYVSNDVNRNSTTGNATPILICPGGTAPLIAGVDWALAGANRRIDFLAPIVTGAGWSARGWSPTPGDVLTLEGYCVATAAHGDASIQTASTTYTNASPSVSSEVACPAGKRPGSGGTEAFPAPGGPSSGGFLGNDWYSAPSVNQPLWQTTSAVEANVTLRRNVWCLPAGQPTITFNQTPPSLTSSGDATFTFTLGDTAGEILESLTCRVDGATVAGCNPSGTEVTGLASGMHTFSVTATNQSSQTTTKNFQWTIDLIPPEVTVPISSPSVTGPILVEFSEFVTGLSEGLTFSAAGQSTPLAGTLSLSSTSTGTFVAAFTPRRPLLLGGRYDVSISSVIEDLAGNAIQAHDEQVRTALSVENTSPVVIELWDRDANSNASGGGYIESPTRGSRATWTVTTTANQSVALLGTRQPNGGFADIYVDSVKVKTISFYRSTTAWKVAVFETGPLSAGAHTIAVHVVGTRPHASSGTWVALDALARGTTRIQETKAVQAFRRIAHASAFDGSYDVVIHRTNGDTGARPAYQVMFDGVSIKGYVTKTANSGRAIIYIDGVKRATVNLYSSSTKYRAVGFSISGLTAGRHKLRVVPVGTASGSNSVITLDRVVVS